MNINETIFRAINGLAGQNHILDLFFVFISNALGYFLVAGLIVFLVFHEDKKKGARDLFVVLSAAVGAYIIAKIIKTLFPHARPFEVLQNIHALSMNETGDSFPSGHATFYMALASALFFYHRKIAYAYLVGALLIGLGRILVGVHWPLDVLAGFIIGGFVGTTTFIVYQKFYGVVMQKLFGKTLTP